MAKTLDADWRGALGRVDAFLAANPQVEASATGLHVPRSCREEFYGVLQEARGALAAKVLPDVAAAEEAAAQLSAVLDRVQQACGARVTLPAELAALCADVRLGASEPFVGRMLSYVQGALDADGLIEAARDEIVPQYELLRRAAYETWMCYALVLALRPRAAYLADTFDQESVACTRTDTLPVGRQKYSAVLRLPEAVFECEDGTVWALKFELGSELDFYGSKPLRRRDFSAGGDTRGSLGRRMALLYRVDGLDAVPFVANRDTRMVFPPTLVVGALWPQDLAGSLYGRAAIQRTISLDPREGALFLACGGCAADVRAAAEPYGLTPRIVEASFDPDLFDSFLNSR